jgi:hypothetical protein
MDSFLIEGSFVTGRLDRQTRFSWGSAVPAMAMAGKAIAQWAKTGMACGFL